MAGAKVRWTRNFDRNLAEIETFLSASDAPRAFVALLDEFADAVVPNLEDHPRIGRRFRPSGRRNDGIAAITEIREYILPQSLILYSVDGEEELYVHLLAVRHHHQLTFDIDAHWIDEVLGSTSPLASNADEPLVSTNGER